MIKFIKSVAKLIKRIACGYTIHAYDADNRKVHTHVSTTFKDALEWAACYPNTDKIRISYEGIFGRRLICQRGV